MIRAPLKIETLSQELKKTFGISLGPFRILSHRTLLNIILVYLKMALKKNLCKKIRM